jgi:hypothetical protein
MIGAATLDVATYEEVEHDTDATLQAAGVVAVAAVVQGLVSPAGVISGVVGALLGWLAYAGLTYFIGTRLFGGTATWGELLRTLGFAYTVALFSILALIPFLGILVGLAVFVWGIAAGVVAIRQALDVSTGQAIVTGLLGWVAMFVVYMLLPGI